MIGGFTKTTNYERANATCSFNFDIKTAVILNRTDCFDAKDIPSNKNSGRSTCSFDIETANNSDSLIVCDRKRESRMQCCWQGNLYV